MYYGQTAPCMKCTAKYFKCHGTCEKYKSFIDKVKTERTNRKENREDAARSYFGERERAKKVWKGR